MSGGRWRWAPGVFSPTRSCSLQCEAAAGLGSFGQVRDSAVQEPPQLAVLGLLHVPKPRVCCSRLWCLSCRCSGGPALSCPTVPHHGAWPSAVLGAGLGRVPVVGVLWGRGMCLPFKSFHPPPPAPSWELTSMSRNTGLARGSPWKWAREEQGTAFPSSVPHRSVRPDGPSAQATAPAQRLSTDSGSQFQKWPLCPCWSLWAEGSVGALAFCNGAWCPPPPSTHLCHQGCRPDRQAPFRPPPFLRSCLPCS